MALYEHFSNGSGAAKVTINLKGRMEIKKVWVNFLQ